jgi:hypothetical protein
MGLWRIVGEKSALNDQGSKSVIACSIKGNVKENICPSTGTLYPT